MPATVADIARRVGKSAQLVSAVLNGGRSSSAASPSTRDAIQRIAKELGYRPNTAAQAVSTGRFDAVGMLLSLTGWKSAVHMDLLTGIQQALITHDWHLMLGVLPDEVYGSDRQLPKALRAMHVDGFLVKYDSSLPVGLEARLAAVPVPQVWVNRKRSADCVIPDDLGAGTQVAQALLAAGHRRIAYVDLWARERDDHHSSFDRRDGAQAAARAAGVTLHIPWSGRITPHDEFAPVHALLSAADRPSAVICASQREAMAVLYIARGLGIEVPRQLSLVVISNEPLVIAGFALATCCLPWEAVGRAAISELAARISDAASRPPCAVPCTYVAGASITAPC
jgi:LacI family transcriptional regulator